MALYKYDSNGIKLLSKEIDGLISQLEELVDLQLKCAEMLQKECLQFTKTAYENPKAELDVSPFLFAAYKNCRNVLEVRNDIILLKYYKEVIKQYDCDSCEILINETEYLNKLGSYSKDRVAEAIKRNAYNNIHDLIKVMDKCEGV